jgi:hypothetical protein
MAQRIFSNWTKDTFYNMQPEDSGIKGREMPGKGRA